MAGFTYSTSGLAATFTDTSTDSGGTIGTHSWAFGDGATSTAASPAHTYTAAGTYTGAQSVTIIAGSAESIPCTSFCA